MSFDDKAKKPTDKTLARALGDAKRLWDKLIDGLDAEYGPLNREWTFYKSWALRLKRKKRTILYLLPGDGHFVCAYVFGGKATEAARTAKLPPAVLKAIDKAPVYGEGRGVRLEVRKAKDVETMKILAAVKMAN